MASPLEVLKGLKIKVTVVKGGAIEELISRVFTTRNLVHFAHLTTNSYAQHEALGDLYEDIVSNVDELAEVYVGEFGKLADLETCAAKMPQDIIAKIKEDADWIKANRSSIAKNSTVVENLIDNLLSKYNRTLFKLNQLH
jgi:DNA-binding ferritin-like protein